jgi:hypothetical protein
MTKQEFYLYYFAGWFFLMWILLILHERIAKKDRDRAMKAIEDLENGIENGIA